MKKYIVKWSKIGEENGTIVIATDDKEKAYEYAHKCPDGKEWTIYYNGKTEWKGIKA